MPPRRNSRAATPYNNPESRASAIFTSNIGVDDPAAATAAEATGLRQRRPRGPGAASAPVGGGGARGVSPVRDL
jgi:hypothetical protein